MEDIERTRAVYKTCKQIIPHKKFTFSKIWIMFAHFEVRQLQLRDARKIMVNFLIVCFDGYIPLQEWAAFLDVTVG